MHLDTVWPGHADVFEKIRDAKAPLTSEQFDSIVSVHGDKLHDTEDEDWETELVGRHLYKVLMDHKALDAKKTVVGAPKRDGVEAYRLLTRQYDSSPTTWRPRCLRTSSSSGGQTPKTLTG